MSRNLTAAEITEKQQRRLSESIPDVKRGIERVTESPTEKAAANLDKAKANYNKAIDSGKTAMRLKAVSLDDWKVATVEKVDRIATGIMGATAKIVGFHEQRQEHQTRIDGGLKSMPTRTASDMDQRMLFQIKEMRKLVYVPRRR